MNDYPFKNLVFEGGGMKCIAYAGALKVLEINGILNKVERVAGSSGGAITATLLGLGFNPAEIKEILTNLRFREFIDNSENIALKIGRFLSKYGWNSTRHVESWPCKFLLEKTGKSSITF